jgi:hypothetical protein
VTTLERQAAARAGRNRAVLYFHSLDRTNEAVVVATAVLSFGIGMHVAELVSVVGSVGAFIAHVILFAEEAE